jgi:hypothetical protein
LEPVDLLFFQLLQDLPQPGLGDLSPVEPSYDLQRLSPQVRLQQAILFLTRQPADHAPDLGVVGRADAKPVGERLLEPDLAVELDEYLLHQARPQIALGVRPGIEPD